MKGDGLDEPDHVLRCRAEALFGRRDMCSATVGYSAEAGRDSGASSLLDWWEGKTWAEWTANTGRLVDGLVDQGREVEEQRKLNGEW